MVQFLFVLLPPPICPTYRHGVTLPDASRITSIFPVGIRGRNTVKWLDKAACLGAASSFWFVFWFWGAGCPEDASHCLQLRSCMVVNQSASATWNAAKKHILWKVRGWHDLNALCWVV